MSQINVDIVNPETGTSLTLNGDLITQIINAPMLATDNTGEIYSPYQIATVNMTSADILSMGATPIELLPAPGANNYYDIQYIIFEFTKNSTQYVYTDAPVVWIGSSEFAILNENLIKGLAPYKMVKVTPGPLAVNIDGNATWSATYLLDSNVYITSLNGANPTTGNGTMRAIICYRNVTFGTL